MAQGEAAERLCHVGGERARRRGELLARGGERWRRAKLAPGRYKPKSAELSTEKSAVGLGEQYAQEYEQLMLGATSAEKDKADKAHEAVGGSRHARARARAWIAGHSQGSRVRARAACAAFWRCAPPRR